MKQKTLKKIYKSLPLTPEEFWQRLFEPLLLRMLNRSLERYRKAVLRGEIVPVPATGISYKQNMEHKLEERKIIMRVEIHLDIY